MLGLRNKESHRASWKHLSITPDGYGKLEFDGHAGGEEKTTKGRPVWRMHFGMRCYCAPFHAGYWWQIHREGMDGFACARLPRFATPGYRLFARIAVSRDTRQPVHSTGTGGMACNALHYPHMQRMGYNVLAGRGVQIATRLQLPHPERYTGHWARVSSCVSLLPRMCV